MKSSLINIHQIINSDKFQQIQDDIATATGLAIITVDYMGVPITAHSSCCKFCKAIRSSSVLSKYCEKCDSRGGLEAARIRKPYIYICHAGILDLAIPIIVDDLYLGAFMAGQVHLEREEEYSQLEYILSGAGKTINLDSDPELRANYNLLPVMSLEKVKAFANMFLHIGNYCVEEALHHTSLSKLNARKQPPALYNLPMKQNEHNHDTIIPAVKNESKDSSKILQPALTYIKQHPGEKISLSKMASLCNISASYFSKLFSKENLGSLSTYVNQIKLEHAKELLHNTDFAVRSIAEDLGFDDCGYFIKIFKGGTGKTPTEFRREIRRGFHTKPPKKQERQIL